MYLSESVYTFASPTDQIKVAGYLGLVDLSSLNIDSVPPTKNASHRQGVFFISKGYEL